MISDIIKKEIELMNNIVSSAIFWGGDGGGPYYCCELEKESLIESLNEWIALKGLSEVCNVSSSNCVEIVIKEK